MSASLLPPRSAEVADIMDATMRVFRATVAKCLPLAMLWILLSFMAPLYVLAKGNLSDPFKSQDGIYWMLTAIGLVACQLPAAIVMLRQRGIVAGRLPDLLAEWRATLRRWPLLVVTALLSAIAASFALMPLAVHGLNMVVSFVLLSIPGIYVSVCFLLLRPVVLFEEGGLLRALERCFRLTRPRWTKFCAAAVIGMLLIVICLVAALLGLSLVITLLRDVGLGKPATHAVVAAVLLGLFSIAAVYLSALWLALYSAASSSA